MKNLLLTATLLMFAIASSAQTVGIIVQPELTKRNTHKGFFAEIPVFSKIGVYSDFKISGTESQFEENATTQWSVGVSVEPIKNLKAIVSRSAISRNKQTIQSGDVFNVYRSYSQPSYQGALMYSEQSVSILVGYEIAQNAVNKRVSIGLGFNF